MDDFGLAEPVDCLGQGIVVGVTHAANRGLDAGLGQPLDIADRHVLQAKVRGMDHRLLGRACPNASRTKSVWAIRDTRQSTPQRA